MNTTEEERVLVSFSTDMLSQRHARCVKELCVIEPEGMICLTDPMRNFLASQTTISGPSSDWERLLACCQAPRDHLPELAKFSGSRYHRLRFKYHRDAGITYATQLLNETASNVWGKPVDRGLYRRQVLSLIEQAPHGMEYRLYDICDPNVYGILKALPGDGKSLMVPNHKRSKPLDQLALLFALGHGRENYSSKSLAELVARQQFFKTFASELGRKHDKNAALDQLQGSPDETEDLWLLYWNGVEAFSKQTCRMRWNDEEQFVAELRYRMKLLSFADRGSAAYHPYKHRDVAFAFGCSEDAAPQEIVNGYFDAIQQVIMHGQLTGSKPSQFSSGTIFSFAYQPVQNNITYQLYVSSQDHDYTFVLTCY